MATVAVVYGGSDRDAAEIVADEVESLSSVSAELVDGLENSSIQYESFDGVVSVGGSAGNNITDELIDRFSSWSEPDFVYDPVIGEDREQPVSIQGIDYISGIPVVALIGETKSDTLTAAEYWSGRKDAGNLFISFAGIDEFLEEVPTDDGSDDRDVDDPNSPVEGPWEGDDPVGDDVPPLSDFENTLKIGIHPWAPSGEFKYEVTVSEGMRAKTDTIENEEIRPYGGDSATGWAYFNLLGQDADEYKFNGEIEDIQCEEDLLLTINGEQYRYRSDADTIDTTQGPFGGDLQDDLDHSDRIDEGTKDDELKEQEDEKNQSLWDELFEAYKNPTGSVENSIQVAMTLVLAVLVIQALGIGKSVT